MSDSFTATVRACELTDRNIGDSVTFTQAGASGRIVSGSGSLASFARVTSDLLRFTLGTERFFLRWDTRVTVTRQHGRGPITERLRPSVLQAGPAAEAEPTTLRMYAGDLNEAHSGLQVEFNAGQSVVHGLLTRAAAALDDMVALTLDGEQFLLPGGKPVAVIVPADIPTPTTIATIDIDSLEFA